MSENDDGLDDLGLGDDFDLGDMDVDLDSDASDGMDDVNPGDRSATSSVLSDTTSSFVDGVVGDKVETLLDLGKASIPKSLSSETDVVTNAYDSVRDEVSKQGASLRKEAKRSLTVFKRFLPEDEDNFLNKIVNKVSSVLGDDEARYSNSGPTQAEKIATEINGLMGAKSDETAYAEQFKEQLAFTRQQEVKEIQATESINIERIRKYLFEVTDKYYRVSLDVNLRQLYTSEEMLAVTKSGFDIFKTSLAAIIKNTALPDVVKIRDAELVGQLLKVKAANVVGSSLFKNGSPLTRATNKITNTIKEYSESATNILQEATGTAEQLGGISEQGMGVGDILGMLAVDYAKKKAGEAVGKQIEGTDEGARAIWDIKNAMADPKTAAALLAKGDGLLASAAGTAKDLMGSDTQNFSVDRLDPNASAYIDNRTKDSINKVIPQLLGKIYGEVKTTRELQVKQSGATLKRQRIAEPTANEPIYSHVTGGFVSKKELKESIRNNSKQVAQLNVARPANSAIDMVLKDTKLSFSQPEIKVIRDALIKTVFHKKVSGIKAFEHKYFKGLLKEADPDLASRFSRQLGVFREASSKNRSLQNNLNNIVASIYDSKSNHANIANDLVERGLTQEAIDTGLLTRGPDGGLIGNREAITKDIISNATSADVTPAPTTTDEPNIKDELKGKSVREKASILASRVHGDVNKKLNGETVNNDTIMGSYSKGGFTGFGRIKEVAGIVHRGEYVLSQDKLDDLLSAVKEGNVKSVLKDVRNIAKDVGEQAKTYTTSTDKLTESLDKQNDSSFIEKIKSTFDKESKGKERQVPVADQSSPELSLDDTTVAMNKLSPKELAVARDRIGEMQELLQYIHNGQAKIAANLNKLGMTTKYLDSKKDPSIPGDVNAALDKIYADKKGQSIPDDVNAALDKIYADKKGRSVSKKIMTKIDKSIGRKDGQSFADATKAKLATAIGKEEGQTFTDATKAMVDKKFDRKEGQSILGAVSAMVDKSIGRKEGQSILGAAAAKIDKKFDRKEGQTRLGAVSAMVDKSIGRKEGQSKLEAAKAALDKSIGRKEGQTRLGAVSAMVDKKFDRKEGQSILGAAAAKIDKKFDRKEGQSRLGAAKAALDKSIGRKEGQTILGAAKAKVSEKARGYANKPIELGNDDYLTSSDYLQQRRDEYTKEAGDTEGYIGNWDKLTEEEQSTLRLEYFSSAEYISKAITSFPLWLRDLKRIDPGSIATRKGILAEGLLDIRNKIMSPALELKEELTKELTDKLTGKGLKELTADDDKAMLKLFYKSEEYQNKLVTDFDEWLKPQGYQRHGKSAIGRLKRALKPSNIFKKTRELDRKMMGAFYRGAGKHLLKSPIHAYNAAKAGVKVVGFTGGLLTSAAKGTGLFGNGPKPKSVLNKDDNKPTGISKLLGYFKRKDDKAADAAEATAKQQKKKSKHERFLAMFNKDNDKDTKGKKPGAVSKILKKASSFITPTTVILAIAAGMSALNITSDDIKSGIKSVKDSVVSTWEHLKTIGRGIRNLYTTVAQLPERISIYMTDLFSKISLFNIDKPDPSRLKKLDLVVSRNNRAISYNKDDVRTWTADDVVTMSKADKLVYDGYTRGGRSDNVITANFGNKRNEQGRIPSFKGGRALPNTKFVFDKASRELLYGSSTSLGVAPMTAKLAELALSKSTIDFSIISGGRTAEQQQALYKKKRSNADGVTNLSDHQTGNAIDIYPRIKVEGKPLNMYNKADPRVKEVWQKVYGYFRDAAKDLGLTLEFGFNYNIDGGGDWAHISIKDTGGYVTPKTMLAKAAPLDESSDSGLSTADAIVGGVGAVTAYAGYKTGKVVYKTGEAIYKGGRGVYRGGKWVGGKVFGKKVPKPPVPETNTPKSKPKRGGRNSRAKEIASKLRRKTKPIGKAMLGAKDKSMFQRFKAFLPKLKKRIVEKLGKKAAARILAKQAAKFVPFVGWTLLAADVAMTTKYMFDGYSFESAASKALIGVDLFEEDELDTTEQELPSNSSTISKQLAVGVNRPTLAVVNNELRKEMHPSGVSVNNKMSGSVTTGNTSTTRLTKHKLAAVDSPEYKPNITIEPVIKVNNAVNIDDSVHLPVIAKMSGKSVDLQTQMLDVLGNISDKLDRNLGSEQERDIPTPPVSNVCPLPTPSVSVKRRTAFN